MCKCGEVAKFEVTVQINNFRGDDDIYHACASHHRDLEFLRSEVFRNSTSGNNIGTHSQRIKANFDAKQANNAFNEALLILNDTREVNARIRIKKELSNE